MNNPVEILLVEDNQDDVDLALLALQKNRIANHIHVVRDGAEALEFLFGPADGSSSSRFEVPKLILLDLKLPKVDGLEVLRRLKDDPRTQHVPVVMMTSSREERDVIESYRLGVNSYIIKPVDFTQFCDSVKQLGLYWLVLNHRPQL
jgi:two-component system response regulator